jgi:NitT/TauT family transport system substrate-binding protein
MRTRTSALIFALMLTAAGGAPAAELLKVSVPQRGQWDTSVTELGMRAGIFKARGLDIEVLYTQGGPESHQAVISGSMDLACGGGIRSAVGAYSRGAPLRIVGSQMIGARYLLVRGRKVADQARSQCGGKTISYSQNGSSSHTARCAHRSVPRRCQAGCDRRPSRDVDHDNDRPDRHRPRCCAVRARSRGKRRDQNHCPR